jgi:nucleoside-diphosphate-sugar epimerase
MTPPRLVILGCGFAGAEVARRAVSAGYCVVASTRQPERRAALERLGLEVQIVKALTADRVRHWVSDGAEVLVAFAPDGSTDAEIAPALGAASHVVYLSTTGVYGAHRGRVDEATPVDPSEPRARQRLDAECCYRDGGATVLRAAGIYGPGRGLHLRIKSGIFRIPGDGQNVVSRIHVADLAEMVLGIFRRARDSEPPLAARSEVFVAADDTPVPQIEAIAWLCRRLGVPMPPSVPIDEAPTTLRHDRAVDNGRIKVWTDLALLYPSYREGFEACLVAEASVDAV